MVVAVCCPVFAGGVSPAMESPVVCGFSVVTDSSDRVSVRFLFDNSDPSGISSQSQQRILTYFLSGLAFSPSDRWVNLTTKSIDAVCAPALRNSAVGRVLVAADIQLKRDASALTDPRLSADGKEFWDKVYRKAESLGVLNIPIAQKVWISAGSVDIQENGSLVYLVRSGLRVNLEADRASRGRLDAAGQLEEYAAGLMRSMIVPKLQIMVDTDPRYASVREVYRMFVLADWMRKNHSSAVTGPDIYSVLPRASAADISGLYNEYLLSAREGDYNITEQLAGYSDGGDILERQYFSGGIDLRSYSTRPVRISAPEYRSYIEAVFSRGPAGFSAVYSSLRYVSAGAAHSRGQYADESLPVLSAIDIPDLDVALRDTTVIRAVLNSL